MIREITAKTLLQHVRQPDTWFGLRYNLNVYRGCQHQCVYCDSRSECYGIEDFRDVLVKVNAPALLRDELARKRTRGVIGFGSMSDPYTPVEMDYGLVGECLRIAAAYGFPVHLITKSDLVLKDLGTLRAMDRIGASVSFTVTTADNELASRLEPGAPSPAARFAAMRELTAAGISAGVTLMPVLPYLTDNEDSLAAIVEKTAAAGGSYIIPAFGMTMRDRQKDYYYAELDRFWPGLSGEYRRAFGNRYSCSAPRAEDLQRHLVELCHINGLAVGFPLAAKEEGQLKLGFSPDWIAGAPKTS